MKKLSAVVVCVLIGLSVLGSASPAQAALSEDGASRLFKLINKGRAGAGADALKRSAFIDKEMERHARYLSDNRYDQDESIAHDGFCDPGCVSDGNPTNSRADRIWGKHGGGYICENVAFTTAADYLEAAKELYKLWFNSTEGHKECMLDLNGYDTDVAGVGVFQKGSRWYAGFITLDNASG